MKPAGTQRDDDENDVAVTATTVILYRAKTLCFYAIIHAIDCFLLALFA